MFCTYQCQKCNHHTFPPKLICPVCYSENLKPQIDNQGIATNYTVDQRTGRILTIIKTTNQVQVVTESLHLIPLGESAYIYIEKDRTLSTALEETHHEKDT